MFKLRFCVGDRFYLCDNQILCEYDYEERLVFANLAATKQQQQQQDDEPQFNRPANPPPASALQSAAPTSSSSSSAAAASSLLSSVRNLNVLVLDLMTTKSLKSDGRRIKRSCCCCCCWCDWKDIAQTAAARQIQSRCHEKCNVQSTAAVVVVDDDDADGAWICISLDLILRNILLLLLV